MPRKACKKCRIIVDSGNSCPICNSSNLRGDWKGRIIVLSEESEIAKKLNIKQKGEYAIKVM